MTPRSVAYLVLAASSILAGCVTEDTAYGKGESGTSDAAVKERIAAFDYLQGQAYVENVDLLAGILKDRSHPLLVEALAGDSSDKVRAGCAIALATGQDDRAREPIARAMTKDQSPRVRYTAAYGLCLFRDSRGLPVLFEALRDESAQVRWDANDRLKGVTALDFAFVATDPPEARAAAVARWEAWYKEVGPGGASRALRPVGGRPK